MGKKNKYLMDYREREIRNALPTPLDFMPTYFIEDEHSDKTINPETIEDLIDFNTAENCTADIEFKNIMLCLLDSLTRRESKVLKLRFGIQGNSELTLDEVGKIMDLTKERVRQLEARALRKMRHPSRSRFLQEPIDTTFERLNEPMPERDMEWGWSVYNEENFLEKVTAWQQRIGEQAKILETARFKLKDPYYKEKK
jgi:RNA polymerase sigma factor (sigma-70 family)